MAKANKSLKKQVQAKAQRFRRYAKRATSSGKIRPSGTMPKSSTESWEIKPSISRTLPHSKRSRHSRAKYGRTTRPITMVPTGSKTRPRKTSMSQLRNGQTSPQRRPSKPSTRPATGKPQDATAWLTPGSNN